MTRSISVFVPAYNEENNIKDAIKSVVKAITPVTTDYEIIIVNDGSTDQTLNNIEKVAYKNKHIKIINQVGNQGLGTSFQKAIALATKNYITVFPGDNDMSGDSLREVCQRMDAADIVIGYPTNQHHRPYIRRLLSHSFTILMNVIFQLNLRYYNGPFIHKLALVKNLHLVSSGFLIYAELKIKLIRMGCSFIEIPFGHVGRKYGKSKAVSFFTLLDTVNTIIKLINEKAVN